MKCLSCSMRVVGLVRDQFFSNSKPGGIKKNTTGVTLLFSLLTYSMLLGQNGVVQSRSFVHDENHRGYFLYVPDAYTGQEDWPLVINYHGFSSHAANQMNIHSKMNVIADTAHFLVAYPQGLVIEDLVFGGFGAGWNIPGSYRARHDDIAFTDSLIDHIAMDFRIDMQRVHATGFSNGGEMAFYLACTLPQRIASVASVANPMSDVLLNSCQPGRQFSTVLIHGTADPFFPPGGGPGPYPPPQTTPSFWASHNNCSSDSIVTELPNRVTSDNSTVTLIQYTGCDDHSEVLYYRVNNGGHLWPGSGVRISGLGNVNMDINASSEIWNFFKRNPHPDMVTGIAFHDEIAPKTFQLHQNFPNPFNPTTSIQYQLTSASHVELLIYNQRGQLVRTLENSVRPAGIHQVSWDGKNEQGISMASSLYFYRLQTGSRGQTRKMLLLK